MLSSPASAQGGAISRVQQLKVWLGCITGYAAGAGAALASSGDGHLAAAGHHTVREAAAHDHRCPHSSCEQQHPITDPRCCETILPYVVESVDGDLHLGVDRVSAPLLRQLKQAAILKLHNSKNLAAWQSVLRAYLEQQLSWTSLP